MQELEKENVRLKKRLTARFTERGTPTSIRSHNGSQFTATALREWLGRLGAKTLCSEPGRSWKNGRNPSFNGKLGDALLHAVVVETLM